MTAQHTTKSRHDAFETHLELAPDLGFIYYLDPTRIVQGFDAEGTYIGWDHDDALVRAQPRVSLEGLIGPTLPCTVALDDCASTTFRLVQTVREANGLVVVMETADGAAVLRVRLPGGHWPRSVLPSLIRATLSESPLRRALIDVDIDEEGEVTATFIDLGQQITRLLLEAFGPLHLLCLASVCQRASTAK